MSVDELFGMSTTTSDGVQAPDSSLGSVWLYHASLQATQFSTTRESFRSVRALTIEVTSLRLVALAKVSEGVKRKLWGSDSLSMALGRAIC